MKTYLVNTQDFGGHQLEYIHHLYMGAYARQSDKFVFVVPKRFEKNSQTLIWPKARNIEIVIMEEPDVFPQKCNLIIKGWINSRTLRKYVNQYHATDVIVISMMEYLPFVPFFINKKVRLSGIVYRIYLYEWNTESFFKKFQDVLKYYILANCKVFHHVYMCNDSASSKYLNKIYKTNKFKYMPDPVASLDTYKGRNIREELGIDSYKKVLLHPGSMDVYKNTLEILKALCILDKESAKNLAVILAGRVLPNIRAEFDKLYEEASKKVQIIFLEGYLPFESLADLFVSCDYVLVPYNIKSQSSGIVGHAAFYGKPVIAVQGGIIGKMVRKWHLGCLLQQPSYLSIHSFLCSITSKISPSTKGNNYLECHTIRDFCDTIYEA